MYLVNITVDLLTMTINGGRQRINGTITQGVGEIDSMTFTIYPNNQGYDYIQSRKTRITAINETTGRTDFDGRVLLAVEKMDTSGMIYKEVTAESQLGYLQDSIQPYTEEANYPLNDFIDLVLNNHNAQVEDYKKIYRGSVDVIPNAEGTVYKGLNYDTTFNTLKNKLVDIYGGELSIRKSGDVLYLDYLIEGGTTRATTIELSKNMQSAEKEINPLDIITRIIPLGAKIKTTETDEEGNTTETETDERLTLVGYNGMTVNYIDDTEKIAAFGIITGVVEFSGVTVQSNLYAKAMNYLTNENFINKKHNITALDLKEIGLDIDGFYCGDKYPVKNSLLGIDETLRIIKKSIDINAAYKASITIGDKTTTLSEINRNNSNRVNLELESLKQAININTNNIHFNTEMFTNYSNEVYTTVDSIVSEATKDVVTRSELDSVKEEYNTKVTQSAEDLTVEFTNSVETVEKDINDNISSKFSELNSYIRYYMNGEGKPIIELGAESSDLTCHVSNDEIGFYENGVKVAYISDNQLYITNATILTRLNLGNFAFIPRDNGNLSFVKVG